MTLETRPATPADQPAFAAIIAQLEGCGVEDAIGFLQSGREPPVAALLVTRDHEVIGGAQARRTPMGALELLGGVPNCADRADACRTLLHALRNAVHGATLSTYASATHWDVPTLEALGFTEVARYERLHTLSPTLHPVSPPTGVQIATLEDADDLIAGLQL